jgi:hypothetical protein
VGTVHQLTPPYLEVHAVAPEGVATESEFVVSAAVHNTGEADAVGTSATFTHTAGAELVAGSLVTDLGLIEGGGGATLRWTMKCISTVPVTISVTPSGTDALTGQPIPSSRLISGSVTVDQGLGRTYLPIIIKGGAGLSLSSGRDAGVPGLWR